MPRSRSFSEYSQARLQRGMSMVEMMVAVVISLIGTVVIFQVFQVNEGVRRETTSGADTQTSGLVALTTIERDLRTAGFGFNDNNLIGCSMRMYDLKRTPTDVSPFPFVPVKIISNSGTTPDVLQVAFGGVSLSPARVDVKAAITPAVAGDPFMPNQTYGFVEGDVVVTWQAKQPCTLIEITKIQNGLLEHNPGIYTNHSGISKEARFNKPGGSGLSFGVSPNGGELSNLGQTPVINQYTVRNSDPDLTKNNQFIVNNLFSEIATDIPIAEQIVHFKAEYGMDDGSPDGSVSPRDVGADDGIVDRFTTDVPVTWAQVIAVRLAVVTRSMEPERPDPNTGDCAVTPDWGSTNYPIVWARGPDKPNGKPIDVRTVTNWRCYRYRVFETQVPLRNLLWKGDGA